jgi:transposase-like protein
MAESQSMTSAGVVAKAPIEEHGDFLRESVAMIAAEIMEAEISRQIGAGKGEVAAEARSTHRNGYRPRPGATRVGETELAVPASARARATSRASWSPASARRRLCSAWFMEACVNGVSTRKVDHLVSELGIHMSKDQVSRICGELDGQVQAFRTRALEGEYPYLWLDAKHLKVRDRGHVHLRLRRSPRAEGRGGQGTGLHLAFYRFPAAHWPKLRSTNNLERVNKEIARRSDVVGIFPNDSPVIRLVGALLIEQNDEWLLARGYLSRESIVLVLEDQGDESESEVAALER